MSGLKKRSETEPVKIRLSIVAKDRLQKIASDNQRTLAGQIRYALDQWIEKEGARKN